MPNLRTRTAPRAGSQNDAAKGASTSNSNARTRRRTQNENNIQGDDKENIGRQARLTRLHIRAGIRPIGSTNNATVLGSGQATAKKAPTKSENALMPKLKTASKGKGAPPPALVLRNKMPLQDITSQFLPAPEAANRGEDAPPPSDDANETETADPEAKEATNVVVLKMPPPEPTAIPLPASPKFAVSSPLPPSSPPSDHEFVISASTFRRMTSASNIFDVTVRGPSSSAAAIPEELDDLWQEDNNDAKADKIGSDSDPFGFKSLQMKLQAQLKEAARTSDHDFEDEDDALLLPVADTSSPRPVRRLKRSLQFDDDDHDDDVPVPSAAEEENDKDNLRPHYTTPCTPKKESPKRRKMTPLVNDDEDLFGPRSSSVLPTSPSPSKPSLNAAKEE
ncbi:hypothetical protein JR316_0007316 [Psilocybe cubensis]|uniref:Uncharacterized protein n=2 Tax=Psilocybe cubensis TaxID=181762 RepID=A0A8H7XPS4_PSICU|nr:hypothetical protein JR316_0007316 [Psilocybe cubensis]KAH9480716.1 hypothetical protein JR316_0007316 [Psilocybe cubensis]